MNLRDTAESVTRMLTPAHLQLLEVCYDFSESGDGVFCGEWIMDACNRREIPFHQGWLTKLANVGLLAKDDSSRGGHRRYYRLTDLEIVRAVLDLAGSAGPN